MNRKLWAPILTLIATATLALATTNFSSSAPQARGKVTTQDFPLVVITGNDIQKLPSGENRLVEKVAGGNPDAANVPTGSVIFTVDGPSTSVPLIKTGTGTLILPNTYRGNTVINNGAQNSANNSSSATKVDLTKAGTGTPTLTKELTGTLILAPAVHVVYTFTNLGIFKFSQVFLPAGDNASANTDIKTYVQQHRPANAMKGWPFARLLIGPARGIAQVEGWKPGTKPTAGSKFVCSEGFCACSGTSDCLNLADSGSCSYAMNCDGSGGGIKCYCSSR